MRDMLRKTITKFEYDTIVKGEISDKDFDWLKQQSLQADEEGKARWVRLSQYQAKEVVKFSDYAGLIACPSGQIIEVLPKVGKNNQEEASRDILIKMIKTLPEFRHIHQGTARQSAPKMNLLEVFIDEFLNSVKKLVAGGLRHDYEIRQDNLAAYRGRMLIAQNFALNQCNPTKFYTEHDEFTANRAENRLLHAALLKILSYSNLLDSQRLARHLLLSFEDIPPSSQPEVDFGFVKTDRAMAHYESPLAWARLILNGLSPLVRQGNYQAPSLLFPLAALFEAYVAKSLVKTLGEGEDLYSQSDTRYLASQDGREVFKLRPDLIIKQFGKVTKVLDTKWKLLTTDDKKRNYGVDGGDLYQIFAYGKYYEVCEVVLIYPLWDEFQNPLSTIIFNTMPMLSLQIVPFDLDNACLTTKAVDDVSALFQANSAA